MARQPLRIVRGSTGQVSSYAGISGELVFNTDTKRPHAMDGTTPGGTALAASGANADITAMNALRSVNPPPFGGAVPRFIIGHNPDNQDGFAGTTSHNAITLFIDVGGYGNPSFSTGDIQGPSLVEAITGAIRVPADSNLDNHVSGVAGYGRTDSTKTGVVGVYGEGNAGVANAHVWGMNLRAQDCGFVTNALWGFEIDVNVNGAGTFARGLDIVGGSQAQPNVASPAIIIQSPGIGNTTGSNPIFWGRGVLIDDGSSFTAIEIGTVRPLANAGSMPVIFKYRDGSNSRLDGLAMYMSSNNAVIEQRAANSPLYIKGNVGGAMQQNIAIIGGSTGIGLSSLPSYRFDVLGPSRFSGDIAFGGKVPSPTPTITGSHGGIAALVNLLLNLDAKGLIINNTTT